jgi:hypothetical protein
MKAEDLGLERKELKALKAVRDGLASGRYRHVKTTKFNAENKSRKPLFNMSAACETHECGTVACIGGWVARELGMDKDEAASFVYGIKPYSPLHELFYPTTDKDWNTITPKKAAQAIDNFIKTSNPKWAEVVG